MAKKLIIGIFVAFLSVMLILSWVLKENGFNVLVYGVIILLLLLISLGILYCKSRLSRGQWLYVNLPKLLPRLCRLYEIIEESFSDEFSDQNGVDHSVSVVLNSGYLLYHVKDPESGRVFERTFPIPHMFFSKEVYLRSEGDGPGVVIPADAHAEKIPPDAYRITWDSKDNQLVLVQSGTPNVQGIFLTKNNKEARQIVYVNPGSKEQLRLGDKQLKLLDGMWINVGGVWFQYKRAAAL